MPVSSLNLLDSITLIGKRKTEVYEAKSTRNLLLRDRIATFTNVLDNDSPKISC